MKRFLALYMGSQDVAESRQWNALPAAARKKRERDGMDAWKRWAEEHAACIIDHGGPLGKTKRTDKDGVADARNMVCAYVLIEAESHEAAARLFENHPHFAIFPGQAVEIMECLPIPTV